MSPARSAHDLLEVIPHGTGRSHRWLVPAMLAVLAAGSVACATTVDGAAVADPNAVLTTAVPTSAGPTGAEPATTAQTSGPATATTAEDTTAQSRTPTSATTKSAIRPPAESSSTDLFPTAPTGTTGGPTTGGGITASTITTSLAKLPTSATTFSGKSDWQMDIAKSWKKFDIPGANEEAAWVTGGGSDSFANNVNVLVEKPTIQVGLQQYLDLSTAQIQRTYPDAAVRSSAIIEVDGRQIGRIQYAGLISGVDLDAVAYVARLDDGWAVATYVTPQGDLTKYAPEVEPYLATLRPGS